MSLSSYFFLFPFSLGKEARKRELKKVNSEIRNNYLSFPVLYALFVIVMENTVQTSSLRKPVLVLSNLIMSSAVVKLVIVAAF